MDLSLQCERKLANTRTNTHTQANAGYRCGIGKHHIPFIELISLSSLQIVIAAKITCTIDHPQLTSIGCCVCRFCTFRFHKTESLTHACQPESALCYSLRCFYSSTLFFVLFCFSCSYSMNFRIFANVYIEQMLQFLYANLRQMTST